MLKKKEIAARFKSWIIEEFGTIQSSAKPLGTTGNTLRNSYLNGRSMIGLEMLHRLDGLGCDTGWLLTGEYTKDKKERENIVLKAENLQLKKENENLEKQIELYEQILSNKKKINSLERRKGTSETT